jgi:methyl coenzyme M reductase subunit C
MAIWWITGRLEFARTNAVEFDVLIAENWLNCAIVVCILPVVLRDNVTYGVKTDLVNLFWKRYVSKHCM